MYVRKPKSSEYRKNKHSFSISLFLCLCLYLAGTLPYEEIEVMIQRPMREVLTCIVVGVRS
eukprot:c30596_g1_i1 orf=3-182(-)